MKVRNIREGEHMILYWAQLMPNFFAFEHEKSSQFEWVSQFQELSFSQR